MIRKLATNNTDNVSGGKIYKISDNEYWIRIPAGTAMANAKEATVTMLPRDKKGMITFSANTLEEALKVERCYAGKMAETKEYYDKQTRQVMPISKTNRFKSHF